jgi:hypothetical protein
MPTTYAELKTEVADFYERNDLTSVLDIFIDLCEAEMQRTMKVLSFETTGNVTITNGTGTLPTGFNHARSVVWSGTPNRTLQYVPPNELTRINAGSPSIVSWYTISGGSLLIADDQSGTVSMTYMANFTPLSGSNTTNALLTNHPSMYLYGTLTHAAVYCKDFDNASKYRTIFETEMRSVNADNAEKKWAGQLVVRPA